MNVVSLVQGSEAWHAHRARYFNASDAPAMMGVSPYETRDQLIHRLATGIAPEVDARTQRRFDDGHRYEAMARPLAEAIIGETLYPVVATQGKLSASSDGLTMDERINFEHKSLNDELRAIMVEGCTGADLPIYHRVQQEQQHMVFGCEKTLFMASKWEGETLIEERHCWYTGDAELASNIAAGWVLLEQDVAAYVLPAATAPAPTGRAPETLPALFITVKGEVTASNLAEFKETALTAIRSVNRELTNDQHFADAEKAVKWCGDIEERVAAAKQHALSQTATIDQLFKTMDDISAEARQVRLDLEKLVKARKQSLKTEILIEAQTALADFLRAKNAKLGRDYMPPITADFAGAIHGKKNFDSMRSAINAALANAKIEANAIADKIEANLATLREQAADHKFLFADTAQIVLKAPDDLLALVKSRIADHKSAEEKKEADTRERIRAEEQAKAEKDARDKLAREAEEKRLADDATARANAAATEAAMRDQIVTETGVTKIVAVLGDADDAPVMLVERVQPANVVPMRAAAPVQSPITPPTLKLGVIAERLAPIQITAEGLRTLGFEHAATAGASKLYHEADFSLMCAALVAHINQVQAEQAALNLPVRIAFESLRTGKAEESDFHTLAAAVNISMVCAEKIDPLVEQSCVGGRDALMRVHKRHAETGLWGLDGPAFAEIEQAIEIYEQLTALLTGGQLKDAMTECVRRMRAGEVMEVPA